MNLNNKHSKAYVASEYNPSKKKNIKNSLQRYLFCTIGSFIFAIIVTLIGKVLNIEISTPMFLFGGLIFSFLFNFFGDKIDLKNRKQKHYTAVLDSKIKYVKQEINRQKHQDKVY